MSDELSEPYIDWEDDITDPEWDEEWDLEEDRCCKCGSRTVHEVCGFCGAPLR